MGRTGFITEGNVRTDFIFRFKDTVIDIDTGVITHPVIDISTMQNMKIFVTKPDGTEIEKDETTGVELFTDGIDGRAHFLNSGGNAFTLDQGGKIYKFSAWIKLLDGREFFTDIYNIMVRTQKK